MMLEEITSMITVAMLASFAFSFAFWLAQKISKRKEESAQTQLELEEEISIVSGELDGAESVILEQQEEIDRFKSKLEEKEQEIVELKERLRFAEKATALDIDNIRDRIANIIELLKKIAEQEKRARKVKK